MSSSIVTDFEEKHRVLTLLFGILVYSAGLAGLFHLVVAAFYFADWYTIFALSFFVIGGFFGVMKNSLKTCLYTYLATTLIQLISYNAVEASEAMSYFSAISLILLVLAVLAGYLLDSLKNKV